jgi:hypothetical protein
VHSTRVKEWWCTFSGEFGYYSGDVLSAVNTINAAMNTFHSVVNVMKKQMFNKQQLFSGWHTFNIEKL